MRTDVAFACESFAKVSERRACKLMEVDRGSYRYEPRADRNGELREALVALARQKPRYGYRRLHALLTRRDHPASVMRIYTRNGIQPAVSPGSKFPTSSRMVL